MKDSANLVVFNSEQDAINAGYRKAKRQIIKIPYTQSTWDAFVQGFLISNLLSKQRTKSLAL